jgi:uncharacterized protein (DUF427 family)
MAGSGPARIPERMSMRMRDWMQEGRARLRHEPDDQRIRAVLGDRTVVDTTRAVLVWEPRRIIPSYGVPVDDVRGDLTPAMTDETDVPGVLHPGIPFGVHSTPGRSFDLTVDGATRPGAVFGPDDPDLDGYAVLDFGSFDAWYAEDERLVAHVRDPYHRVEARRTGRRIRIESDGVLLAESDRATLVYETSLPTRFYLPAEDVVGDRVPSARRTSCAYKGEATYLSFAVHGQIREDLAWSYAEPLDGLDKVRGLVAFFDDVLDVFVDGRRRERPQTLLSTTLLEEFGIKV